MKDISIIAVISLLVAIISYGVIALLFKTSSFLLGYIIVFCALYALPPLVLLCIAAFKNKLTLLSSMLIPSVWLFSLILFYAHHRDFLKYGFDFSQYYFKYWFFMPNRLLPTLIPVLIMGPVYWALHSSSALNKFRLRTQKA